MNPIRAAVYARVSKPGQAKEDKISIPDQLRECKEFIEKEGWQYTGEFIDPGVSSAKLDRPGLTALLSSLDKLDVVVAWDFDRLSRERRSVAGYILDTLDENRKQVTSVKQPIPIYDPADYDPRQNDTPYLLREMAGLTSGMDNRRRFRTLQKGLKDKFNQGYMITPPPYGYRTAAKIDAGKIVKLPRQIVPKEAQVVRRMYREYLQGKSYVAIASALNADGIPSRTRPYWNANTINYIIRNPVYCGTLRHISRRVGGKIQRLPENEWVVVRGQHSAIIDHDTWNRVQEIRRRKCLQPRASGTPALLSGLLRCGYCGGAMCKDGHRQAGYYSCAKYKNTRQCRRNTWPRAELERIVMDRVFAMLRSENVYDEVRTLQAGDHGTELQSEITRLSRLVADFSDRKTRLFDLFETGGITRDEFVERNAHHASTQRGYATALLDKQRMLAALETQHLNREHFREVLRRIEEHWDACDLMQRKATLTELIEKIVVMDSAQIHLRLT